MRPFDHFRRFRLHVLNDLQYVYPCLGGWRTSLLEHCTRKRYHVYRYGDMYTTGIPVTVSNVTHINIYELRSLAVAYSTKCSPCVLIESSPLAVCQRIHIVQGTGVCVRKLCQRGTFSESGQSLTWLSIAYVGHFTGAQIDCGSILVALVPS